MRFNSVMKWLRKNGFKVEEFYKDRRSWYIKGVKDDVEVVVDKNRFVRIRINDETYYYDVVSGIEDIEKAIEETKKVVEKKKEEVKSVEEVINKLVSNGFEVLYKSSAPFPSGTVKYESGEFEMLADVRCIDGKNRIEVTMYLDVDSVDDVIKLLNMMKKYTSSKSKK